MIQYSMDPNAPLIVGLAGQAGSGKTVTADNLSPIGQVVTNTCICGHETIEHLDGIGASPSCALCDCKGIHYDGLILWTHLFFALPIYRIVTARQKIIGDNSHNRILYEVHEAIVDLFGRTPLYSAIKSYDDLIALVKYVSTIPCEPEGEKPRTFMQEFGSLCREYDEDVFVKWIQRKIQEENRSFNKEYPEEQYPGLRLGVVLSDVRYENEARMILSHPNGALYKLVATPEVIQARLYDRDGKILTAEQASHASENGLKGLADTEFTKIVDTSLFTVGQQAQCIRDLVSEEFNISV